MASPLPSSFSCFFDSLGGVKCMFINECDFKDLYLQIFSDHAISNHANSIVLPNLDQL